MDDSNPKHKNESKKAKQYVCKLDLSPNLAKFCITVVHGVIN